MAFMRQKIFLGVVFIVFALSSSFLQSANNAKHPLILNKINVDYRSKGGAGFQGFESKGLSALNQSHQYLGKWAQIEVQYRSFSEWTDEVTLKFYVLTDRTVLQDSITQINVPEGRRHFAAVYLHPTTLQRYGEIKRVAVQILYQGELVDTDQWPQKTRKEWWKEYPIREGLLKKEFQTPFILDQPSRYEDTK